MRNTLRFIHALAGAILAIGLLVPTIATATPAGRSAFAQDHAALKEAPRTAQRGSSRAAAQRDVYLVLAGGAGLGNYEAGYAATVLQFLRENRHIFRLRGISGTSAGGINALAGALEYCRTAPIDADYTSANYDAWMPISWKMIYDENLVTREAVFHHQNLATHGARILAARSYRLRHDCDLVTQVAVTRNLSPDAMSDPQRSVYMVEYLGVRVTSDALGQVVYRQLPPLANRTPRRAALLADPEGIVAPEQVLQMIMATAAFPAGFPHVAMTILEGSADDDEENHVRSERVYYDGGVFENVPVRPILPFLHDKEASEAAALVIIVDLDNPRIPSLSPIRNAGSGLTSMAGNWLKFARARDYASSVLELEAQKTEIWRAFQRYPVTSEFLSSFAGFLDKSFREVDYALGVHDAVEDLRLWQGDDAPPPLSPTAACAHQLLLGETTSNCSHTLSANHLAILRGLVASAEVRCQSETVSSMGCASFREENLADRLPPPPVSTAREARLRRAPGKAPADDFQAFLEELRFGDFEPEMADDWLTLRGEKGRRPEVLWSRLIEDALHRFANKQAPPHISSQVAFETLLSSSLPVLPRPSASALINLNGLEVTMNAPLSPRFSADIGLNAEWALRRDRERGWHLFSAGPVARVGWMLSKRQALVSSIADLHAGVLFGPAYPDIVEGRSGPGDARGDSRPNAAVFAGVAPRFVLLRRLQVDFPLRAYWLCTTPACTQFASARPAYSITFRIGWNWTLSPRIRAPKNGGTGSTMPSTTP